MQVFCCFPRTPSTPRQLFLVACSSDYVNGKTTVHSGSRVSITGKQEDAARPHGFCAYLCHFWQYSVWGRRAHRKWFPEPQASTCQTYRESFFDYGGRGIYLSVYRLAQYTTRVFPGLVRKSQQRRNDYQFRNLHGLRNRGKLHGCCDVDCGQSVNGKQGQWVGCGDSASARIAQHRFGTRLGRGPDLGRDSERGGG
jgi:hypothetical protein